MLDLRTSERATRRMLTLPNLLTLPNFRFQTLPCCWTSSSSRRADRNVGLSPPQRVHMLRTGKSGSRARSKCPGVPTPTERSSGVVEPRSLSSNNPWASIVHAVSPAADVAVSSPQDQRTSTPMLLSVPPRTSSKRSSLPSPEREQAPPIVRPASSSSQEVRPTSGDWPLSNEPGPDDIVYEELFAGPVDEQGWAHNPSIGWSSKSISWKPEQVGNRPRLSIHKDAYPVIFESPENWPEDLAAPVADGVSLVAAAVVEHVEHAVAHITPEIATPTRSPTPIRSSVVEFSPSLISPIRGMKPARQPSSHFSPRKPSSVFPTPSPLSHDIFQNNPAVAEDKAVEKGPQQAVNTLEAEVSWQEVLSEGPPHPLPSDAAQKATSQNESAIEAKKLPVSRKSASSRPSRGPPSWMAPTISSIKARTSKVREQTSSLPKTIGRKRQNGSATTLTSHSRVATAQSRRPSGMRSSKSATPISENFMVSPGNQTESVSPFPVAGTQMPTQIGGEMNKTATLRLKAKQSIRNLFQKRDAPAVEPVPTIEGSKRTSLASSGKALAKRISKNFSKTNLPDDAPDIPQSELENLNTLTRRQTTVGSVAEASSTAATARTAYLDPATATIVNEIIDMNKDAATVSKEGMRSIDIVELIVEIATRAKEFHKTSTTLGKITREAIDCSKVSGQYARLSKESTEKARLLEEEAVAYQRSARQARDMADSFFLEAGEYKRKAENMAAEMGKADDLLDDLLEYEFEDDRLRVLMEQLKAGRLGK
ncbi:hypothetical protein BDU57DRAFT_294113 [Ampelomyces quisqualis]|uniref:Uncharacterized protein n=1 Tax=Ampelomyces quisqualis TaxID=50730 RepID=A0A6A5QFG0_AMPQU|nr:hypothetical protein BDU57DRAFT_294113 [Ampelomyces quisqualis]